MPRLRKPGQGRRRKVSQPRPPVDLASLATLPDWAILSDRQLSAVTNLSEDTHTRLRALGKGVRRVELSEHRHGVRVADVKAWIEQRTSNGGSDAA